LGLNGVVCLVRQRGCGMPAEDAAAAAAEGA
jgi:hypothetical protein